MNALVIPTIREDCIEQFLEAWDVEKDNWSAIIVIEDNPTKSFKLPDYCTHYSWEEIEEELGDDSWIISRRDSAIRSFGFYIAYTLGADTIYTLDDDCYPPDEQALNPSKCFINGHERAFTFHKKWTELVPGCRSRGMPYINKGELDVSLNVGLWSGIPDLDSIQTLSGDKWGGLGSGRDAHRIIPQGQYFPMCGMNLAFKREMTPLMYFPLMGEDSPYRRFDDIWCGIVMKKVADQLGMNVSCGNPLVEHKRASDPFVNLVKEAPGIATNEHFWETIDQIDITDIHEPIRCMQQIGSELMENSDTYLQKVGKAIGIWAGLF